MSESAGGTQPIRKEFEKVVKRQKLLSKKTITTLDSLLADLAAAKQRLQDDPLQTKKVVGELNEKAKEAKNIFAAEQKDSYGQISKLGKTLDKTFKAESLGKPGEPAFFEANKPLLNEVIANHFYRQGKFALGETFASEAKVDLDETLKHQFLEMYHIFESIRDKNLLPALAWAQKNQERLQAKGSSLLFRLHHLQYISLLLKKEKDQALQYAKGNFGPFATSHLKEIQRLMSCFLYMNNLSQSPYADLVAPSQWLDVQQLFTRDCCSLMGLSQESALYISVTVGSVALPTLMKVTKMMQSKKTEWSQQNELPVEIPLNPEYRYHSVFVCPVAKEQVTEQNPAMFLPCGHVICQESLSKIVKGNGRFKCPYCPSDASKSAVRKIHF